MGISDIVLRPDRYFMAGNPGLVELENTGTTKEDFILEVTSGGKRKVINYSLSAQEKSIINIQEYLSKLYADFEVLPYQSLFSLREIYGENDTAIYLRVNDVNGSNNGRRPEQRPLIRGAYPNDILLKTSLSSANIFHKNLLGPSLMYYNPILTDRAERYYVDYRKENSDWIAETMEIGNVVHVRENELLPFYCCSVFQAIVEVYDVDGKLLGRSNLQGGYETPYLHSLDLRDLSSSGTRYFKVLFIERYSSVNLVRTIHVCVTPARTGTNVRYIDFENTYGVIERIAVSGMGSETITYSEDDPTSFLVLNEGVQLPQKRGLRRNGTKGISLFAGYGSQDELRFLRSMAESDVIYLDGERVLCKTTDLTTFSDKDKFSEREVELNFEYI